MKEAITWCFFLPHPLATMACTLIVHPLFQPLLKKLALYYYWITLVPLFLLRNGSSPFYIDFDLNLSIWRCFFILNWRWQVNKVWQLRLLSSYQGLIVGILCQSWYNKTFILLCFPLSLLGGTIKAFILKNCVLSKSVDYAKVLSFIVSMYELENEVLDVLLQIGIKYYFFASHWLDSISQLYFNEHPVFSELF